MLLFKPPKLKPLCSRESAGRVYCSEPGSQVSFAVFADNDVALGFIPTRSITFWPEEVTNRVIVVEALPIQEC